MSETMSAVSLWLIPACPLAAAVSIALVGETVFRCRGYHVAVAALVVSCLLSLWQLGRVATVVRTVHTSASQHSSESQAKLPVAIGHPTPASPAASGFDWITIGGLRVKADVQVDPLTAVMLAMVTFVSLLVVIYSGGYMQGDPGYSRFFAEISLFVFSMCMLVMARNFLMLFVFWEAVGLCSYLLIGFWFDRPTAASAAVKAFIMNRIGDAAFLIGLFLIWQTFHSLDFSDVFQRATAAPQTAELKRRVLQICLCLFVGACGKSAQFPLHLWLPDAMEGPTPVSALIHAATMVTAGVYLVARCTPLFVLAPEAQAVVATIGGITALLGALIAVTQTDLKRVLAYSTISQLGYMFLALGSAAADERVATIAVVAAIFHMFTHAFFKALLFLSAGNVMHAMGNVIDMRDFGGLKRVLPVTHGVFLCGAASLAGFPFLSGFWSKDEIVGLLHGASRPDAYATLFQVLFVLALVTAALTAFYTFRAYFLTFHGPLRLPPEAFANSHHQACELPNDNREHSQVAPSHVTQSHAAQSHDGQREAPVPGDPSQIHEGPSAMKWPLVVLAVFALVIGLVVGPLTGFFAGWVEATPTLIPAEAHHMDWTLAGISSLLALLGIGLAYLMYGRPSALPDRLTRALRPFYQLSLHKFYLDEIATLLVILPVKGLAFVSLMFDQGFIDRLVDEIGSLPSALGKVLRPVQNGLIQSYGLVMVFGLAIFLVTILQVWMVPIR